jgi:hypothetical protein
MSRKIAEICGKKYGPSEHATLVFVCKHQKPCPIRTRAKKGEKEYC